MQNILFSSLKVGGSKKWDERSIHSTHLCYLGNYWTCFYPSSLSFEFQAVINITFHRPLKILFKVTWALSNQTKSTFYNEIHFYKTNFYCTMDQFFKFHCQSLYFIYAKLGISTFYEWTLRKSKYHITYLFQLLFSPLTHAQTGETLRNSYTLSLSYSISGRDSYKQGGLLKDM